MQIDTARPKMVLINVADAPAPVIDWAVAKVRGYIDDFNNPLHGATVQEVAESQYRPTASWAVGGEIIESAGITVIRVEDAYGVDEMGHCNNIATPVWGATDGHHANWGGEYSIPDGELLYGPTPLVAAMRCYLATKMFYIIEVPEELLAA